MPVTLPPFKSEVPYVLKAHRALPASERPVFYYRRPDPEELADYADTAIVRIRDDVTHTTEERRFGATMIMRMVVRHLTKVERLFEEDGVTPITIPAIEASGRIPPERKRAISRLPREWQMELAEAISNDVDSEELLKN